MFRRLLATTFAFVIAAGCGAAFLALAAFFDPATRAAGFDAALAGLLAIIEEAFWGGRPESAAEALVAVLRAIVVAAVIAPLAAVALIGELARTRAWLWYAGACAFLAAASPWIARAAKGLERAQSVSALEGRIALLFFLAGTVTGTVYWLIAGRGAGADGRRPPAAALPPPASTAALPAPAQRAPVPPVNEQRSGDQRAAKDDRNI
jgi:hypothetical protein